MQFDSGNDLTIITVIPYSEVTSEVRLSELKNLMTNYL